MAVIDQQGSNPSVPFIETQRMRKNLISCPVTDPALADLGKRLPHIAARQLRFPQRQGNQGFAQLIANLIAIAFHAHIRCKMGMCSADDHMGR